MTKHNKITALYSRLSDGDEDRDGGESNSIKNQKMFLEQHAQQQGLTNVKHYVDDDESGRFFDRPAYSAMIEDMRSGKIGTIIIKDMTRWGRDYLEVGNAMGLGAASNQSNPSPDLGVATVGRHLAHRLPTARPPHLVRVRL
ncbi:MAG: recombinase family protein, partial [Oscillospiraceae bacterium]|nr:recombinase family protein [Oscillospiraceae bacterium]